MFMPIDRFQFDDSKLYTHIVDNIGELIREGKLKAGDRLPSERELAEMFEVSRVPVREALKILEYVGIVKNVRGKGKYIRSIGVDDILETINFALLSPEENIQDLFETRVTIESRAAELAALRRTENNLVAMEKAIANMANEIEEGKDGTGPSLEFHIAIMRASNNKILYQLNMFLLDLLELSRKRTLVSQERRMESLEYHKRLLKLIKNKDSVGSGALMIEHLKNAEVAVRNTKD